LTASPSGVVHRLLVPRPLRQPLILETPTQQ
jgi:hypothetical protein